MNRSIALGLTMLAGLALATAVLNGLNAQTVAHSGYNTPIWKTIELGTYRNANELRDALDSARCGSEKVSIKVSGQTPPAVPIYNDGRAPYCHLEALANEIIGRPAFALSRTKSELDLVVLSVFELGFGKQGASIKDIYERAELLGFALCPPEVGPALRCSTSTSRWANSFTSRCSPSQDIMVILSCLISKMQTTDLYCSAIHRQPQTLCVRGPFMYLSNLGTSTVGIELLQCNKVWQKMVAPGHEPPRHLTGRVVEVPSI
jgi:hypothetical protein